MKKTSIMAALLIISASPALAQQWKHLGTHGASTSYFFKPKTLSVSKDKVVATWTKKEFHVDAAAMTKEGLAPDQFTGTKSLVAYEEFDCSQSTKRTLTGITKENGRKTDSAKTGWQEVAGGSLDESLLNSLCRAALPGKP